MKRNAILVLATLFLVLVSIQSARGGPCGPGCPACSGKSFGDPLPQATILASSLYIPDGEEETAVFNMRYGLFS